MLSILDTVDFIQAFTILFCWFAFCSAMAEQRRQKLFGAIRRCAPPNGMCREWHPTIHPNSIIHYSLQFSSVAIECSPIPLLPLRAASATIRMINDKSCFDKNLNNDAVIFRFECERPQLLHAREFISFHPNVMRIINKSICRGYSYRLIGNFDAATKGKRKRKNEMYVKKATIQIWQLFHVL